MSDQSLSLKRWPFWQRAMYRFVAEVVPRIFRLLFDFEVINSEYVTEFAEGKPVIFCSNHRSHLDTFAVVSALAKPFGPKRYLALMGAGKTIQQKIFFRLFHLVGVFPVFPDHPQPAISYAVKTLEEKLSIFMAPQGKRITKTPFQDYFDLVREGRTGVGRIVLLTKGKIPVVPIYVHGTAEALSKGQLLPKFRSYISISFGKPLYFHKYFQKNGWMKQQQDFFIKAREIVDQIMEAIREQLIKVEKYYFQYLEWKFKKTINQISFSEKEWMKYKYFFRKLNQIHPKQLQEFLQSKGIYRRKDEIKGEPD
ncbi:MAG: lysophospholipid acyltransferase family protein [Candidatus Hodarchaeales archaeon]|jgi:1-acyl-sn-glycerol-3-phosphate acyltransferase